MAVFEWKGPLQAQPRPLRDPAPTSQGHSLPTASSSDTLSLLSPQTCHHCCLWTLKESQDRQGSPARVDHPGPPATRENRAQGSQECTASLAPLGPRASRALGNPASQASLERRV